MSEEQNVLEQLRNRPRTSVPHRTDSLISETDSVDSGIPNQHPKSTQQDSITSPPVNSQSSDTPSTLEELELKLSRIPKTKRRSAIVLEEEIDLCLSEYCRSQQITVETFLEAAWTISQSNKTTLYKITKEAQSRYKTRKEAGRLRRLITMLSKE